jgi:hypothetical protein
MNSKEPFFNEAVTFTIWKDKDEDPEDKAKHSVPEFSSCSPDD